MNPSKLTKFASRCGFDAAQTDLAMRWVMGDLNLTDVGANVQITLLAPSELLKDEIELDIVDDESDRLFAE